MSCENSDYRIEVLDLSSKYDIKLLNDFLMPFGFIDFSPESIDYTIILYNLNEQILGCGSCSGAILKFIAVAPEFRESSAFAQIVTHLNDKVLSLGYKTVFVYTKPENSIKFQGLGFRELAVAPPFYALLEFGFSTIVHYKKYLQSKKITTSTEDIASIVVNCNPFTNGHKYLIEKAAGENEVLYLFVVETDRSVFPYKIRRRLIEEGIAHLKNVVIIRGSDYIVSHMTFPSYFLKNVSVDSITKNQTELDLLIFSQHIASEMGIKKRYVGNEIYCRTTAAYNLAMKKILPQYNIELIEIPRKTIDSSNYISASKVRNSIQKMDFSHFDDYLPESTLNFLRSTEAYPIIENIRKSTSRH